MDVVTLPGDAQLLERIKKGDEKTLLGLYRSSRPQVLAYVTRNNGGADDAEDLLQEALIILWERVRTNRFVYEARLETFVVATVRNLWLRRLARKRREAPGGIDPETEDPTELSPLEALVNSDESRELAVALEKLGEPCKSLLLLFYWEELSMDEIARKTGYANATTAKAKKHQCKKALEKVLKGGD
jgi:RNA polymerase sigma factor (sigma-70 family)